MVEVDQIISVLIQVPCQHGVTTVMRHECLLSIEVPRGVDFVPRVCGRWAAGRVGDGRKLLEIVPALPVDVELVCRALAVAGHNDLDLGEVVLR